MIFRACLKHEWNNGDSFTIISTATVCLTMTIKIYASITGSWLKSINWIAYYATSYCFISNIYLKSVFIELGLLSVWVKSYKWFLTHFSQIDFFFQISHASSLLVAIQYSWIFNALLLQSQVSGSKTRSSSRWEML